MKAISLKIEVELGATPEKVIAECLDLAKRMQINIRFTHNGINGIVSPGDIIETAYARFDRNREMVMAAYKDSQL